MVYRSSMIRGLAVLLLSAVAAPFGEAAGEEVPATVPPPATTPAETTPAPNPPPEATTPTGTQPSGLQPAATPPAGANGLLPLDARMEAYDEFRKLFELGRFDEALPFAERVVVLSEDGPDRDHELPIAYNNLGATQLKIGNFAGAEASYIKSLEQLESSQGISSRRLIVPLAGLGATYAAMDQHAKAADLIDRALAVSRRSEGLFNLNQLPLVNLAAESHYAIGDYIGAERERQYAIKVLEQNYGYADARVIPAVLGLAEFYESVQEYPSARAMYLRVRDTAMKETGGYNVVAVRAMISVCRTHRLQYTMDPDSLEDDNPLRDPISGELVGRVYREARVPAPAADRLGLKSAEQAVEILRAATDPPKDLFADALLELGDWYQATSRPQLAIPLYAEASQFFSTGEFTGKGNPLVAPRMIFYRAPMASRRAIGNTSTQPQVRTTVFSFVVSERGATQNVQVVSTDMDEGQLSQSRRAISRAIYSPRFENGQAVRTEGVQFTSDWYEEYRVADPNAVPKPATPATTSATSR
jgi:tetratricopeptide (TPR) repeat protein